MTDTTKEPMVSLSPNTIYYVRDRPDHVQFVSDTSLSSKPVSRLTTITKPAKFVGYYAGAVITGSLAGTLTQICLRLLHVI